MARRSVSKEIFIGLGILVLCHIAMTAFLSLGLWVSNTFLRHPFPAIFGWALVGLAVTQLLYVVPLCIRFKRCRRFNVMKGVIIGAVITFLLSGGCFALLFWLLSGLHST